MKKLLFLTIVIFLFGTVSAQNINQLKIKTADGRYFDVKSELDGKTTLIAFWATWCKPCRKELPALLDIYEEYKDKGLEILAISIDNVRSLSKVKSYIKKSDLPYIFLIDPSGENAQKLMVNDVPYTLLADKEGNIVYTHRGYSEGDERELEDKIVELLYKKEE